LRGGDLSCLFLNSRGLTTDADARTLLCSSLQTLQCICKTVRVKMTVSEAARTSDCQYMSMAADLWRFSANPDWLRCCVGTSVGIGVPSTPRCGVCVHKG
jgi:hypothetical protein